jgi:hypothetical protein
VLSHCCFDVFALLCHHRTYRMMHNIRGPTNARLRHNYEDQPGYNSKEQMGMPRGTSVTTHEVGDDCDVFMQVLWSETWCGIAVRQVCGGE